MAGALSIKLPRLVSREQVIHALIHWSGPEIPSGTTACSLGCLVGFEPTNDHSHIVAPDAPGLDTAEMGGFEPPGVSPTRLAVGSDKPLWHTSKLACGYQESNLGHRPAVALLCH